MSMQSEEKKKRGPAMHFDVPEDTSLEREPPQPKNPPELELLSAAMPSDVPKDTSPEDTSFTESAMLEPVSPKIAGREKPDKEEEALVIPAKATVGKKPIFDIKESIQKQVALNNQKQANTWRHQMIYCWDRLGIHPLQEAQSLHLTVPK